MSPIKSFLVPAVLACAVAGCAGWPAYKPEAVAELAPASGSKVGGTVNFVEIGTRVHVSATLSGLTPGPHGIHIHDRGDCSASDATSAGGHYNPTGTVHGNAASGAHHAGDLPNLVADAAGNARYEALIDGVTVRPSATSINFRALVIHADADDYATQPAGNSGTRIACGEIRAYEPPLYLGGLD